MSRASIAQLREARHRKADEESFARLLKKHLQAGRTKERALELIARAEPELVARIEKRGAATAAHIEPLGPTLLGVGDKSESVLTGIQKRR